MKKDNFRGDLTDNLAKKEALQPTCCSFSEAWVMTSTMDSRPDQVRNSNFASTVGSDLTEFHYY